MAAYESTSCIRATSSSILDSWILSTRRSTTFNLHYTHCPRLFPSLLEHDQRISCHEASIYHNHPACRVIIFRRTYERNQGKRDMGLVGVGIKSWSAVLCCTTQDWFIITFGTALFISISLNILREFLPLLVFSFLPLRLHSDSRWSRQAIFVWPVPPSYLHWRGRSARGKWDSWDLAIDARLQRWYSNIGRTTWSCQRKWKKTFCHWCSDV